MYKALNYWVFGGFGPNKTPYEFVDFAAAQGLDGVEMTVGDCLPVDIGEAECRRIAAYAKEKGVGLRTLATGCYGAMSLGAALGACGYDRTFTVEMIPFSRLPDQALAEKSVKELKELCA